MENAVFLGEFSGDMSATNKYTLTEQAIQDEWKEIEAAKANPARFGRLYDRYYEPIFRFIYQRTANEELTADLTSQTFLKAMQNLQKYEFKGVPFSAWLFRIATNEISQFFRQQGKKRVVSLEDNAAHDLEDEFEDKQELEINIEALKEAIQELDPDDVEMLQLRFFEKRPFKEVADILEITENNAKVRVYRIVQRLREIFLKRKKHT